MAAVKPLVRCLLDDAECYGKTLNAYHGRLCANERGESNILAGIQPAILQQFGGSTKTFKALSIGSGSGK